MNEHIAGFRGIVSGVSLCAAVYGAFAAIASLWSGAPIWIALAAALVCAVGVLALAEVIRIGDEQRGGA